MKRHFLQLAHSYVPGTPIGGWYASEKMDGMRAFWDGAVTRGLPCSQVAFANTSKDGRYVTPPISTGLWSRYGKSIQAPGWFLDSLPPYSLDGELYVGRGKFQFLMSTVKDIQPGPGWKSVRYMAFDMPPPHVVFSDGEINETNFKKKFVGVLHKHKMPDYPFKGTPQFREVYAWMCKNLRVQPSVMDVHHQMQLHPMSKEATFQMLDALEATVAGDGEGLILRSPTSTWIPSRVRTCLKVKGMNDAEGIVTGYIWGRETNLGSKLLGLMGALVLDFNGKRLELSGFTDAERMMRMASVGLDQGWDSAYKIGCQNPGKEVQDDIHNPCFPRGSKITFKFRELTQDGIPKEARYWRKRDE